MYEAERLLVATGESMTETIWRRASVALAVATVLLAVVALVVCGVSIAEWMGLRQG
jgi:hypothetical protein